MYLLRSNKERWWSTYNAVMSQSQENTPQLPIYRWTWSIWQCMSLQVNRKTLVLSSSPVIERVFPTGSSWVPSHAIANIQSYTVSIYTIHALMHLEHRTVTSELQKIEKVTAMDQIKYTFYVLQNSKTYETYKVRG